MLVLVQTHSLVYQITLNRDHHGVDKEVSSGTESEHKYINSETSLLSPLQKSSWNKDQKYDDDHRSRQSSSNKDSFTFTKRRRHKMRQDPLLSLDDLAPPSELVKLLKKQNKRAKKNIDEEPKAKPIAVPLMTPSRAMQVFSSNMIGHKRLSVSECHAVVCYVLNSIVETISAEGQAFHEQECML